MGLDPTRPRRTNRWDVLMVVGALAATAAVVLWAVLA